MRSSPSPTVGSPIEDAKGVLLADLISELNMSVCNEGRSPIFVRGRSESQVNVTFASATIRRCVNNWKVLDTEWLNLHKIH